MKTRVDQRAMVRIVVVAVIALAAFMMLTGSAAAATEVIPSAAASHLPTDVVGDDPGLDQPGSEPNGSYERVLQLFTNGIVFGLLLALASVGLSLIYGTTGLSNFAHGEQVSLGALLTFFFVTPGTVSLPLVPWEFSFGWPLVPAALVAIALSAGSGWLQDRFIWSPLRRRKVSLVQQMIVSIGFSLALLNFIQWWFGAERKRLSTSALVPVELGPVSLTHTTLVSVAISLICLGGVGYFLLRTRTGRATRAVSDNRALAAASGIRVERVIRLVWMLAAGLAAVGGILLALYDNATAFDVGARLLLLMFAAVTLGGLGHPFGALVGSIVIGLAVEMSTLVLGSDLKYGVALGILVLVLLVRPQGILGRAERVG